MTALHLLRCLRLRDRIAIRVLSVLLCVGAISSLVAWSADATSASSESAARPADPAKTPDPRAEEAWKALESLQAPAEPAEWATHPPTDDARREFQAKQIDFACRAADLAKDFYTRFPDYELTPAARGMERAFMGPYASQVLEHRVSQIETQAATRGPTGSPPVLAFMEQGARDLLVGFAREFVPNQLLLKVARQSEPTKARRLAEEVRDRKGLPDFVKEEAEALLKKLDRVGNPLALQFKAVDDRDVDLENLKGKVVLVDFWATWCVPCVAELPAIRTLYEKRKSEGFEIIGISFDQQRDALTKFVTQQQLPWPQFWDGKGWDNKFGREFGVGSIPTLWLVDRKGILRDLNAGVSLEEKVRQLLAEQPQ